MKSRNFIVIIAVLLSNNLLSQNPEQLSHGSGPEAVLELLEKGVANNSGGQEGLFRFYSQAGIQLTNRGNYDLADSLFVIASQFQQFETDSTYIFDLLISRALMNKIQGKHMASFEDYLVLLNHYQSVDDIDNYVFTLARIGEFYRSREDAINALDYLDQAKAIIDKNEIDSAAVAYYYSRVAACQNEFKQDVDSTIYYAKRGLDWATSLEAPHTRAMLLNELGFAYMHLDLNDSVTILNYFKESEDILFENGFYRDHVSTLGNQALYYYRMNKPQIVISILRNSIAQSEKNNWFSALEGAYELLADNLRAIGEFDESNQFYKKAFATKAENYRKDYVKEVNELEAIQDKINAEKALEIAVEDVKQKAKTQKIILVLALLFAILGATAMVLYYRIRKNNRVLNAQQKLIEDTNHELSQSLVQKNVLYRELNHRVKNNLTVLSGLVYLQETSDSKGANKELYQSLRHRIQSMAIVHQNLYEFKDAVNVNFQQYLEQLIPNIATSFNKGGKITHKIQCQEFEININEAIPLGIIINELITNSFKYAFDEKDGGEILLSTENNQHARILHYKDNGSGITDADNYKNPQSLGMRLVSLMVEQLHGRITYLGDNKGVHFKIEIEKTVN